MDISIENQTELQEKIEQSLNSLWISGALSLTGPLAKLSKVGKNENGLSGIVSNSMRRLKSNASLIRIKDCCLSINPKLKNNSLIFHGMKKQKERHDPRSP